MGAGPERQTRARESGTRERWGGALECGGRSHGAAGRGQDARGWSAEPGSVRGGALLRGGGPSAWGWRRNAGAQGRGRGGRGWAPRARRRDLGTEWAGPIFGCSGGSHGGCPRSCSY